MAADHQGDRRDYAVNRKDAMRGLARVAVVPGHLKKLRFQPMINSPAEFAKFLLVQAERWPPIIKAAGLKAQ